MAEIEAIDNNETDAGSVGASSQRYIVTNRHDHGTLKLDDVVVIIEAPDSCLFNYLIRVDDITLHPLKDDHGQYVHIKKIY
jgi:hypothetical protein